jgi:hypothetical protein
MRTNRMPFAHSLFIAIAAIFLFSLAGFAIAELTPQTAVPDKNKTDTNLIQFKAGKHIIGFAPNKAYLAGIDHALSVEFLGTKGVMPKSDKNPKAKRPNKAEPLGKVTYENLWPGINLTYEAAKNGITESTYIVMPNADVSKIRLKYNVPVNIHKNGSLRFKFAKGYMSESAPIAWQEINGKKVPVKVTFMITNGEIGFKAEKYDSKYALVIDPTLAWNTFYGPSSSSSNAIVIDGDSNIYVAGSSGSWIGPNGESPINHYGSGTHNMFVLKLNKDGAYQWHTFFPVVSPLAVLPEAIALDNNRNIYITGGSSVSWGSPLNTHAGNDDCFVLKLNANGDYQWHTFYGSGNGDSGTSIVPDNNGHIYIAGASWESWNGPSNDNGPQSPLYPFTGDSWNGFVLKLDDNGLYKWHGFYGYIDGRNIAIRNGYIFVASDVSLLKIDAAGTLQWLKTYLSGGFHEWQDMKMDDNGNIFITGSSKGSWGSPLHPHSSSINGVDYTDVLVMKLDNDGTYQWHTYYPFAVGSSIALDGNGSIFITGAANYDWGTPVHHFSDWSDIFVLSLDAAGAYQWHTFYGASLYPSGGYNYGDSIVADGSGNLYITGSSSNTWGYPLNAFSSGNNNAVILKIAGSLCSTDRVQLAVFSSPYGDGYFAYFFNIQDAYNGASSPDFDSILLQDATFTEDVVLASDRFFWISGGYSCSFRLPRNGWSTINGSLTIRDGTVAVENIIIK